MTITYRSRPAKHLLKRQLSLSTLWDGQAIALTPTANPTSRPPSMSFFVAAYSELSIEAKSYRKIEVLIADFSGSLLIAKKH